MENSQSDMRSSGESEERAERLRVISVFIMQ